MSCAACADLAAGTWMVVLAALVSSTLLNCIFPFFTYVESSGMLGEFLPQVRGMCLGQQIGRSISSQCVDDAGHGS